MFQRWQLETGNKMEEEFTLFNDTFFKDSRTPNENSLTAILSQKIQVRPRIWTKPAQTDFPFSTVNCLGMFKSLYSVFRLLWLYLSSKKLLGAMRKEPEGNEMREENANEVSDVECFLFQRKRLKIGKNCKLKPGVKWKSYFPLVKMKMKIFHLDDLSPRSSSHIAAYSINWVSDVHPMYTEMLGPMMHRIHLLKFSSLVHSLATVDLLVIIRKLC